MKKLKIFGSVFFCALLAVSFQIQPSKAERFFWESVDKCTYGCYQPGGDCNSPDPWEQQDC